MLSYYCSARTESQNTKQFTDRRADASGGEREERFGFIDFHWCDGGAPFLGLSRRVMNYTWLCSVIFDSNPKKRWFGSHQPNRPWHYLRDNVVMRTSDGLIRRRASLTAGRAGRGTRSRGSSTESRSRSGVGERSRRLRMLSDVNPYRSTALF